MSATLTRKVGSAKPTKSADIADERASSTPALRLVIGIALYAIPALTALQPLSDFDTWWHLRTGQWVIEHRAVPSTDPFTTFGEGKPWVAYSWLYGVLTYGFYHAFGPVGIMAFRVAMSLAIVAALQRLVTQREPRFFVAAAIVGGACVALAPMFMSDRPWLFTILFSIATLAAILRIREGATFRSVWWLPLLFALWANIHIQFVHGLFILGLAVAASLWESPRVTTRGLLTLAVACAAATLLNPYGVRVYSVVLEYSRQTETYALFTELKALEFRQPADWALLGLTLTAVYALGRRQTMPIFEMLLLAAGAYFSFHSKHDLWFVALASVVALLQRSRFCEASLDARTSRSASVSLVVSALVVLALVLFVGAKRDLGNDGLQRQLAKEYPTEAVAFLKERHYAGPLFHHIDWGGYLIWNLPETPACIDGRTNLHGDKRVHRLMDNCAGGSEWVNDPELAEANVVLLQKRLALASLLRMRESEFELAYEDSLAIVFVRKESSR